MMLDCWRVATKAEKSVENVRVESSRGQFARWSGETVKHHGIWSSDWMKEVKLAEVGGDAALRFASNRICFITSQDLRCTNRDQRFASARLRSSDLALERGRIQCGVEGFGESSEDELLGALIPFQWNRHRR